MRVPFVIFGALIAPSRTGFAAAQSADFYVAAEGNDAWSGTKATRAATGGNGGHHG